MECSYLHFYIEAIMLAGKRKPFLLPICRKNGRERSTQMLRTRSPHLLERLIIKVEREVCLHTLPVLRGCETSSEAKVATAVFSSEVTIYPGEKYEPSDTGAHRNQINVSHNIGLKGVFYGENCKHSLKYFFTFG